MKWNKNKETDQLIILAIQEGKSERLIAEELGVNTMRIHRLKKSNAIQSETKVTRKREAEVKPRKQYNQRTTSHYRFSKVFQCEQYILDAF